MGRQSLLVLPLTVALLATLPGNSWAQTVPNQINPGNATGIQPYNAYGGVRENINLATGNLNQFMPLLTLPGRNGHDLVLGLEHDSKSWNLHHEYEEYTGFDHYWWETEIRVPGAEKWLGLGWYRSGSRLAPESPRAPRYLEAQEFDLHYPLPYGFHPHPGGRQQARLQKPGQVPPLQ
jgi:hypothetical protein